MVVQLISKIKDFVLVVAAVGGLMAGAYSLLAKPIQDEGRLKQLERQMAYIQPRVNNHDINVAVLGSRLDKIENGQDKILEIVIDIKRKI